MLSGRLIKIEGKYYNKVLDHDNYSYFVCINNCKFIKIPVSKLDKKTYIYNKEIIEKEADNFKDLGLSIEELLLYSPFVSSDKSLRKNYYKKKKNNQVKFIDKSITIHFD